MGIMVTVDIIIAEVTVRLMVHDIMPITIANITIANITSANITIATKVDVTKVDVTTSAGVINNVKMGHTTSYG